MGKPSQTSTDKFTDWRIPNRPQGLPASKAERRRGAKDSHRVERKVVVAANPSLTRRKRHNTRMIADRNPLHVSGRIVSISKSKTLAEVKMKVPYVHSNFQRVKDDFYPTIDKRCVYGFLQYFNPRDRIVDVCAPDGSGIVDTLKECGYHAGGIPDAFTENLFAAWVVTNPPYDRKVVDGIINRQIKRIDDGEVRGVAVLLRSNFDFAKSRRAMFDSKYYYGQIKLRFRPWWSEDRTAQPIHNYVWQVWTADGSRVPVVLYSNGEKP